MRLFLVQHGDAKSADEDPNRPLTERGRADVAAVSGVLAGGHVRVDRIVHSGKMRARETADILAGYLRPTSGAGAADGLDPMADPMVWEGRLTADDRSLMLVGHLPHLARLASLLLCGDPERNTVAFQRGSVLCIERSGDGQWSVRWMMIPELVQPMG
jgi:phosphohistidine phosphatase